MAADAAVAVDNGDGARRAACCLFLQPAVLGPVPPSLVLANKSSIIYPSY